jgi:hypothetical protein
LGVPGRSECRSASATQVLLSRLTRILLLVAVALCLGAPTAGAAPATPLDNNLGAMWTTILQTPSAQNPIVDGGCYDLGGTVAPFGLNGFTGTCAVQSGTQIFVAAASAECSTFEGNGTTDAELRKCAAKADANVAPTVTVDGVRVPLTEVETPLLNIVLPKHNILGVPAGQGLSVGHGWVALLDSLTPGTHEIKIETNKSSITTTIVVRGR